MERNSGKMRQYNLITSLPHVLGFLATADKQIQLVNPFVGSSLITPSNQLLGESYRLINIQQIARRGWPIDE
jgi:hypothetical protein